MIDKTTAEPVIQFLRGITCDGLLTSEEVWALANWLNQQRAEILKSWPASALVPVLNSVFADGKLTDEEMEELALTISSIQELWAEQFADAETDEGPDIQDPPRILVPLLPPVPFRTTIVGEDCSIDLSSGECTCADWKEHRASFPPGDFRRACQHIIDGYRQWPDLPKLDPLFQTFLSDHHSRNRGTSPKENWKKMILGDQEVLYSAMSGRDWINIYAPNGGAYQRFGFNKTEGRWSYGEAPKCLARKLRELFSELREQTPTNAG